MTAQPERREEPVEIDVREYAYSWRRDVLACLWAIFWACLTLVALYHSIPFIAVVAGGQ